jgi:hypothetical protein
MKKSKYGLLIAIGVVAAAAALALPAMAGSSAWLHEGEPLEEHAALTAAGGEVIEIGSSVLLCQSSATLTTEGGSSAQITAYSVDKASCAGVAGQLEGCTVTAATTTGLPWSVTVNTTDLTAASVRVTYSFNEACSIGKVETNFPGLTITPEEPSAIHLFRFSQEGTAKVDGKETAINYVGSLQLPEEEFGTYGIG